MPGPIQFSFCVLVAYRHRVRFHGKSLDPLRDALGGFAPAACASPVCDSPELPEELPDSGGLMAFIGAPAMCFVSGGERVLQDWDDKGT